jgi:chemotaxis protein methyltransferase CheR
MEELVHQTFPMSKEEFDFFRGKIYELAGISLSDVKIDLLQSRLRTRVIKHGLNSYAQYKNYLLRLSPDDDEWECFINQLTTNKTDWFREDEHFTYLTEEFLPKWKTLGKKHLSVWCAASSTGEEPYTLAMVLNRTLARSGFTFDILATDIDTKVLELAKNGVYPREGLELIPDEYHRDAFMMGTEEISNWMKVRPEIKERIKFQQLNLTDMSGIHQKFDIVFCRNVLIYFNGPTIVNVVNAIHDKTHENSLLIISHSESLQNVKTKWKYMKPSVYKKGPLF